MAVPYLEIDLIFLSNLDPKLKLDLFERLKKLIEDEITEEYLNIEEFLKKINRSFFFMLCPYCNSVALLTTAKINRQKYENPMICPFCGEKNQYDKITQSLEKTRILYELAANIESINSDFDNKKVKRTLLEQSIVTIATGLEVFLRDIYSTTLNIKYIKPHKSLIHRFYKDTRTEFINLGNARRKYIQDLGIDFKNENFKKLNLLMLKRNVIVHNNGIVDNTFLGQCGLDCKLKDCIPIEIKEIEEYIYIVNELVEEIGQLFQEEFETETNQRMVQFLQYQY
ncbi:MAG: hypothetical protein KAR07_07040 [Spirochaetes bacterium]|nr:hypothetical protein [Spirochaetota bacterium]